MRFRHRPPILESTDCSATGFTQSITLFDGRQPIGSSSWHIANIRFGVMQILELAIDESHRRDGAGGTLLLETIAQAKKLSQRRQIKLRRAWIAVEQKTQVNARAFLTKHGFHHVSTIGNLLPRQDVLIYSKSFD